MTAPTLAPEVQWGDERLPERFWANVYPEPNTGCWLWGAGLSHGYARASVPSVTSSRQGHRIAWLALVGDIAEGFVPDHTCEVKCCVNLAHLKIVTGGENSRRSGSPWRANAASVAAELARPTFRCEHPKTPDNIRTRRNGLRLCRTCDDRRTAERDERARVRLRDSPELRERRNAAARARRARGAVSA